MSTQTMAFESDTASALMIRCVLGASEVSQGTVQHTTARNLDRRDAFRYPPGSKIIVEEVDGSCDLRRSNAVHRSRTKKFSAPAHTDCASGSTTASALTASTATDGRESFNDESKGMKAPRPSRFKEHLDEDGNDADSHRSAGSGFRPSEKLSKLKRGAKRAIRRHPSYAGVRMYEGT